MKKWKNVEEWEDYKLSLPLANSVSGEHEEHRPEDAEYVPNDVGRCRCDRCVIIRIKKLRAFRFRRTKCSVCGKLFSPRFVAEKEEDFGKCDRCLKAEGGQS